MKTKTLLVIPVTYEKPSAFIDLRNSCKFFNQFDLLIAISSSNSYLEEYYNTFYENTGQVKINIINSTKKSVIFKESINSLLSKEELNKYEYLMSTKSFENEYIHNFYNCIDNISETKLKLFYPRTKYKSKQEKSFSQSEIFIIEKNFMRSNDLNPFYKFTTFLKFLLKIPFKKIELI